MNAKSQLPINQASLQEFRATVQSIFSQPLKDGSDGSEPKLGLSDVMYQLGGSDFPLGETSNSTSLAVFNGFQVGLYVAAQFDRTSGLLELETRNKSGTLGADEGRFMALKSTASAIAVYVAARYALWRISSIREDEARAVTLHEIPPLAIRFTGRVAALQELAWHLALVAGGPDVTELYALRAFAETLGKVVGDIVERSQSLTGAEFYTGVSYRLEGTEFVIDGFESSVSRRAVSAEIAPIQPEKIVGNHDAKHLARRIAQRLALYDFDRGRNPFCDVGLFQLILMIFGIPGTGKTLLIRLLATYLKELCEARGVPFHVSLLPSIVDPYQGKSAINMENWMNGLYDKGFISLLVIDDAENVLQDRTGRGASEGTQGVVQVFLTKTEGAGSIIRGNSNLVAATNIPEMLDPAVLSRVQVRLELKGARGKKDVLDQHAIGLNGLKPLFPDEFSAKTVDGYELMSAQKPGKTMAEAAGPYGDPRHAMTREALEKALRSEGSKHGFSLPTRLFAAFQDLDPRASSRDLRNIQTAVADRMSDFDIPEDFYTHPDRFLARPYEERVNILREMARHAAGGLTFGEVLLEETIRYLDSFALIKGAKFDRDVEARAHELRVELAARQKLGIG